MSPEERDELIEVIREVIEETGFGKGGRGSAAPGDTGVGA